MSAGADLSSLPFPFAGLLGITETTLVVDPTRPVSLRGGMLAAITLGRRVAAAQVATPENIGQRHVVAIGVPQDVPLRAEINQVLPLLLLPDGSRALVAEDETLTEVLGAERLGAIQESQVPWAPGHRIPVAGRDRRHGAGLGDPGSERARLHGPTSRCSSRRRG